MFPNVMSIEDLSNKPTNKIIMDVEQIMAAAEAANKLLEGIRLEESGSQVPYKRPRNFKVFKAPDYVDSSGNSIFLAGSIDQGQAEDWQEKVTNTLFHLGVDCTILNPRRENWDPTWDPTWDQSLDNQEFVDQVNWELKALDTCDLVTFYFSETSKAPISFLELGLALEGKKNAIVFCPKGFYRKGNVDLVCARYGVEVFETKEEYIAAIVDFLRPADVLTIPTAVIEKAAKTEGKVNWKKLIEQNKEVAKAADRELEALHEELRVNNIPIPNITVFKIKDTNTGMFSTGGYSPRWTTKGKTWNSIGFVKSSLKQHIVDKDYKKEWKNNIPISWVVVEISSVNGIKEYSARNLYPLTNPYIKFSGEHLLAELGRI